MAAFTSAGIGFSTVLLLYTTVGFFFFQLSREVWRRLILLPALLLAFSNSFLSASVLASFSFNRAISLSLVLILFLYSLYLSAALRFTSFLISALCPATLALCILDLSCLFTTLTSSFAAFSS